MKRLLTSLVSLFLVSSLFSQTMIYERKRETIDSGMKVKSGIRVDVPIQDKVNTVNVTRNIVQNGWAKWGNTCAGCPSFWYQVLRTDRRFAAADSNYYYYYYFNFYNNSFYENGQVSSTYMTELEFFVNGISALKMDYLLIDPNKPVWGAWVKHPELDAVVEFTVEKVSVH